MRIGHKQSLHTAVWKLTPQSGIQPSGLWCLPRPPFGFAAYGAIGGGALLCEAGYQMCLFRGGLWEVLWCRSRSGAACDWHRDTW